MTQLDDLDFVTRYDPKGMYRLTVGFPDQCARALEIARQAPIPSGQTRPDSVVLTGLGGSAAGGDFVRALFEAQGPVPFVVNRDYSLPAYVTSATLVFAVSYSGNTEETVSAYRDARGRGCPIVVVASGGKLAAMAREDGFPLVAIPGGQPPRTALGYLFVPVLHACERLGLLPPQDYDALGSVLRACVGLWSVEVPTDSNPAKTLALALHGRMGVLYGLGHWQGLVARRWKGQINENAKNMVVAHAFPELCHNEILGWVRAGDQGVSGWTTVVLQDGTESAKMRKRAEVVARLTSSVTPTHRALAHGSALVERILSLALLGDFVSLYLAALNGVDPENIDSIETLKSELASVA